MSADLFGNLPPGFKVPVPGAPKKRKGPRPNGYAAMPGTGPEGKCCKDCANYVIRSFAKNYRKCLLMRAVWTGGPGTDIRARSPACSKFSDAAMSREAQG